MRATVRIGWPTAHTHHYTRPTYQDGQHVDAKPAGGIFWGILFSLITSVLLLGLGLFLFD